MLSLRTHGGAATEEFTYPTKRTYEKMLTSKEPATDESSSETPSETTTNPSATSTPATSEPPIDRSYIDSPNTVEAPESPSAADLPMSATHIQIEGGENHKRIAGKVTCFQ
jgi:hypothetical protein